VLSIHFSLELKRLSSNIEGVSVQITPGHQGCQFVYGQEDGAPCNTRHPPQISSKRTEGTWHQITGSDEKTPIEHGGTCSRAIPRTSNEKDSYMWSNVKCCIRPVGKLIFSCLYVLALYTAAARSMLSRSSCLFDRSSHPYRCRIYYQVLTLFPRALHLDPETPVIELNLVIPSCSLKELRIYVVSSVGR
jgi:hypothetical protein